MRNVRIRQTDQQRRSLPLLRVALSAVAAGSLTIASGSGGIAADDESAVPSVLTVTPSQPEGPFYPVELPIDRDSDLTVVDGADRGASGEPLAIEGLLLTSDGTPVEGATVEIWQTDHLGVYLHPQDPGISGRDVAFQGYGESVTDVSGVWSFRTILPEIYGGRPRHIHAQVRIAGEPVLTTQIYFSGGDIPEAGSVALTGDITDALVVEALDQPDADGEALLHAQHVLVIPEPSGQ